MQTSEISIRELSGGRREVRLRGAGLPFRGQAAWPGKQRVVTTWLPGNAARATQQVLGPVDQPSRFSGEWNTTRLLATPCGWSVDGGAERPLVVARDLVDLLDDVFRRGSPLLVTWKNQLNDVVGGREIAREGRASDWDFTYDTMEDVKWSVTFEWSGRGQFQQRAVTFDDNATQSSLFALNQAAFAVASALDQAKLVAANRAIPRGARPLTLGQLEQLAGAPSRLFRDFARAAQLVGTRARQVGDVLLTARAQPYAILNQALDVARNAQAQANGFVDAISRKPPEAMTTRTTLDGITRAASYFGDGTRQAQFMARRAQEAQRRARERQQAVLSEGESGKAKAPLSQAGIGSNKGEYRTYITRPGDTLLGLALKFYGTDAGMFDIARANSLRLTQAVLPARLTLLIPPLSPTSAAQSAGGSPFGTAPSETSTIDGQSGPVAESPGVFP